VLGGVDPVSEGSGEELDDAEADREQGQPGERVTAATAPPGPQQSGDRQTPAEQQRERREGSGVAGHEGDDLQSGVSPVRLRPARRGVRAERALPRTDRVGGPGREFLGRRRARHPGRDHRVLDQEQADVREAQLLAELPGVSARQIHAPVVEALQTGQVCR